MKSTKYTCRKRTASTWAFYRNGERILENLVAAKHQANIIVAELNAAVKYGADHAIHAYIQKARSEG